MLFIRLQGQKRLSHGAKQQLRKCQNWREGIGRLLSRLGADCTFEILRLSNDASRELGNPSRSGEWGPV